jgi:hypothetical protein
MDKIYTEAGFNPDEPLLIPISDLSLYSIDILYELAQSPINKHKIDKAIYLVCKYGPMKDIDEFEWCTGIVHTNYQLQKIVYRLCKKTPNLVSYEDMTNFIWAINGIKNDPNKEHYNFYKMLAKRNDIKLLDIVFRYVHSNILEETTFYGFEDVNNLGWIQGGKFIDKYQQYITCIDDMSNTKILTSYLSGRLEIKFVFFHFIGKYGVSSGIHKILALDIKISWQNVHDYSDNGYLFEGIKFYKRQNIEELVLNMLAVSEDSNESRTALATLISAWPMHINILKGLIAVIEPIKGKRFMYSIIENIEAEDIQDFGFDENTIIKLIKNSCHIVFSCQDKIDYILNSTIEIDWSKCTLPSRHLNHRSLLLMKRIIRGPKVQHNPYNGKDVVFNLPEDGNMSYVIDEIYFAGAQTLINYEYIPIGKTAEELIILPVSTRAKKYHRRYEPYKFAKRLYDIIVRFD